MREMRKYAGRVPSPLSLEIKLSIADSDDHELAGEAINLRSALLGLDLDDVALASSPTPEGAKGDAMSVGTIVIALANSAVLVAVVQSVRAWIQRCGGRSAKITDGERTFELTGLSSGQQQEIIDALLAKADTPAKPIVEP
ncbi:effector-associated constant component EACC1 [Nonomuraea sediminis]|uniref:effector-associated constant component EACC1 n=1 Tax=Nonomuraea sediminis TaxID=2835864 RepID=UPI001BDDA066|nr:hypothetical protein [Nonomuraea sediminis]